MLRLNAAALNLTSGGKLSTWAVFSGADTKLLSTVNIIRVVCPAALLRSSIRLRSREKRGSTEHLPFEKSSLGLQHDRSSTAGSGQK